MPPPTGSARYLPTLPASTRVVVVPENTAAVVTPEFQPALELKTENYEFSRDIPKFSISQSKPVLSGISSRVKDFNLHVDNLYELQIYEFIQMVQENEPWRVRNLPGFKSWLDLKFEQVSFSNDLISLKIQVEIYIAGAAHPDLYSLGINYDLDKNKSLELGDLFKDEERFLQVIASHCREGLAGMEEMLFEEGLLPEPVNYQNWVINEDGFMVIFNPYQIAPYAMGTVIVTVPWEVLSDEINPSGPLVRFLSP